MADINIVNVATGRVLDVSNANPANGVKIQQWNINGDPAQRWQIVDIGNGLVKIVNAATKKVLDVPNANPANGVKIQQWDSIGDPKQQWRLVVALPTPTSNLKITGVTETSVSLAWQNNATNAKGCSVRYWQKGVSTNPSSDNLPAPNVVGAIMTHTVTNLQPGTQYEFFADAWNDTGVTDSNFVLGTTVASPPKPTIQSFTAQPNVVQVCQPTVITLSWQVSNTQQITISRQGNVVVNQANAGNANPWTASAQDPQVQDTNVTYTLLASSNIGSASSSASINAGSNYPLVHTVQLTNDSSNSVDVWFYDLQDNQGPFLFSLSPGDTNTATFPDCELLRLKAIDSVGTARWELNPLLGNSNGPNLQYSFN